MHHSSLISSVSLKCVLHVFMREISSPLVEYMCMYNKQKKPPIFRDELLLVPCSNLLIQYNSLEQVNQIIEFFLNFSAFLSQRKISLGPSLKNAVYECRNTMW